MLMMTSLIVALSMAPGSDSLDGLIERHEAWVTESFPETSLARGNLADAARLTDMSQSALARRHAWRKAFREELDALDASDFDADDRINAALLREIIDNEIRDHEFRLHLMPMDQRWGPHQTIARLAVGLPFRRQVDFDRYCERLAAAPRYLAQMQTLMRAGLEGGWTPPRIALRDVPNQIDALLAPGGLDVLIEPLGSMPATIREERAVAIHLRVRESLLPAIRAALERYRTFIVETYLPQCRDTIAASALPDGSAYYAHQLRKMTTTDMTAREVHETGLHEVARIRSEMLLVIGRTDFVESRPELTDAGDEEIFRAFINWIRTAPEFIPPSADALLADYRALCKEIDEYLPALFRKLPRMPYGVGEIPAFFAPSQTTGYYSQGNLDAGQPGRFMVNTYALDQRPTYEQVALALHEAVPGHHLQIALAQEMESLPAFRRDAWFTAYGEGWALYSERLGTEMGLYDDPYDDFGRLLFEMWRACRLVVDPGMHAFGWTREASIQYMKDYTALSELNIVSEIDRYIVWPGQATAYKIGELRMRAMRRNAERKLGAAFDLRTFHDVILSTGSVPLHVVEARVEEWIDSLPVGVAYD